MKPNHTSYQNFFKQNPNKTDKNFYQNPSLYMNDTTSSNFNTNENFYPKRNHFNTSSNCNFTLNKYNNQENNFYPIIKPNNKVYPINNQENKVYPINNPNNNFYSINNRNNNFYPIHAKKPKTASKKNKTYTNTFSKKQNLNLEEKHIHSNEKKTKNNSQKLNNSNQKNKISESKLMGDICGSKNRPFSMSKSKIKPKLLSKMRLDDYNDFFSFILKKKNKLKELIEFLIKQLNWDIHSVKAFLETERLNHINNDKDILDILEIFKIYKPSKDILKHLKYDEYHSQSILKKINHEVVNFIFGKNNLKNRKELLTEISLMNPTVDNNKIRAQFITIIEILKGNKEKNSKEFLKIYKKNKEDEILIVFLIKKLNEIQSINIRESQILSLLLLINKSDSKGKIAQIETGQGKTIIILMLASFLALKYNCKVFIATSNSELAKRDAKMNRKFFENCGLEIFPNDENDDDYLSSELYNKKRIFYGTASTFCGLIIRQKLEEGFEKNFYDSLIIDEIDNLTIDNYSTFTYLCTPINGFELLNPFYILIYCIAHCLKKTNIT